MSEDATDPDPFLRAAAVVPLAGCLLAALAPPVAGASAAFAGSVVTSAVLGLVFAGRNRRLFRRDGRPSVAAATLTTVFGGWFMLAPLLYEVGFLATAGTQLAGLLVAAFAFYLLVAALADGA